MQFRARHAQIPASGDVFIHVDDLVAWTRQLEQLRGKSPGLDELRAVIEGWRQNLS